MIRGVTDLQVNDGCYKLSQDERQPLRTLPGCGEVSAAINNLVNSCRHSSSKTNTVQLITFLSHSAYVEQGGIQVLPPSFPLILLMESFSSPSPAGMSLVYVTKTGHF